MTTEHIETAIIGAGQAGLATAYHLQRRGRPCLILDGNAQCRRQLARPVGLAAPLHPGRAERPARAAVPRSAMVISDQGRGRRLPRRRTPNGSHSRCVRSPASTGWKPVDGKYLLRLGADRIIADNVVVATGTFGRTPSIPDFALDLDPSIRQLHSSEYRRPAQLKPGRCSWSARRTPAPTSRTSVASTHPTVLAGRDPGQVPVRLDHWTCAAGLCRSWCSSASTCSPGARPSAAKRWTRSGSTAYRCCG